MEELDLLEQTRRDDVYVRINELVEKLGDLGVFPSLVWLWTWDIVKYQLDYYFEDSGESYVTNPKFTEKDVWDMFWTDADKNGFTLEYGAEDLQDAVFDWMLDRDILVTLEEEEEDGNDTTVYTESVE